MCLDDDAARLHAVRGFAYLLEDRDRWADFLTAAAQEAPALWSFLEFATEAYDRFWESFNSADEFAPEQIVAELQTVLTKWRVLSAPSSDTIRSSDRSPAWSSLP